MLNANADSDSSQYMDVGEMIPDSVPAALAGSPFADAYLRDLSHHQEGLAARPRAKVFLEGLAGRANVLRDAHAVFFFGGAHISTGEFHHVEAVSGHVAQMNGQLTSITGSGPGVMEAAHLGVSKQINGKALNVGLTLPDLLEREVPGEHNHALLTVRNMARRLELFLRSSQAGVVFPGGVGTLEEVATICSILSAPANIDHHYPFVLSEPFRGNGTYMSRLRDFLELCSGEESVCAGFVLQQGDDKEALNVLDSSGRRPSPWNSEIHLPGLAFSTFKLHPFDVGKIDLRDPQDDPERFFGHLRWFMNMLVQLTVVDSEGAYLQKHGIPQIPVSRAIQGPLNELLENVWSEGRVKTELPLSSLVGWNVHS